jgi:hypothetical protein
MSLLFLPSLDECYNCPHKLLWNIPEERSGLGMVQADTPLTAGLLHSQGNLGNPRTTLRRSELASPPSGHLGRAAIPTRITRRRYAMISNGATSERRLFDQETAGIVNVYNYAGGAIILNTAWLVKLVKPDSCGIPHPVWSATQGLYPAGPRKSAILDIPSIKCYLSSHDLQGRVQFPIGGIAREPQGRILVKFQGRR